MGYCHLDKYDREVIQNSIKDKKPIKLVAKILRKHRSTIYREKKRNTNKVGWYSAKNAQRKYSKRWCKQKITKIEKCFHLKEILLRKLRQGHSPEQIVGRLKVEYPEQVEMHLCPETIYNFMYRLAKRDKIDIAPLLRQGRKRRKRRKNRYISRFALYRRSIHKRPEIINQRKRIGDYEGDLLEGTRGSGGILTLVDRKSSYVLARKVSSKKATVVSTAMRDVFAPIDDIKSITLDNGLEFAEYNNMEQYLHCQIYFADPAAPWQKGKIENTNALFRQFFPKRTSFINLTNKQVDTAVRLLNHRPRKTLGYLTPWEVFWGYNKPKKCRTCAQRASQ